MQVSLFHFLRLYIPKSQNHFKFSKYSSFFSNPFIYMLNNILLLPVSISVDINDLSVSSFSFLSFIPLSQTHICFYVSDLHVYILYSVFLVKKFYYSLYSFALLHLNANLTCMFITTVCRFFHILILLFSRYTFGSVNSVRILELLHR